MKSKPNLFARASITLTAFVVLAMAPPARAADGTWSANATPLFWRAADTGNWVSGIVADGSGFTASFTNDITGDRVVNIDADKTIGNIIFGDSAPATAGSWTIGNNAVATNNLILAGTTPTITVNTLGTNKTATISAIIEGTAGLKKDGAGTLVLSGSNTYTGGTTITAGTLSVAADSNLGNASGGITLNGGKLVSSALTVFNSTTRTMTVGASGGIWQSTASGGSPTYAGNISGAGNTLTIIGGDNANARFMDLKGAVTLGQLLLGSSTTSVGLYTTANITSSVSLGASQVLVLQGVDGASSASGTYNNLAVTFNGGSLRNRFGVNTLTQNIQLTGNGTIGVRQAADSLTLSGSVTSTALSGTQTLNINSDTGLGVLGSVTISGGISDGTSGGKIALNVGNTGSATVSLGGTNSYTGGTTINAGGALSFLNTGAKSSSTTVSVATGATLGLGVASSGSFFTSTDLDNYLADAAPSGNLSNVTWTSTSNLGIDTTQGNFTYSSNIAATGKGLVKLGANTLTLSGTNAYTGTTTATAGVLLATKAAALPGYNSSAKVIFNGGTVGVTVGGAGWATADVDTLLTNATKTSGALGIDTSNGNLTQWTAFTTTNLGTTLGLTKLGSNALTLSSANTYTGATTIRNGSVVLDGGSNRILSTGSVVIGDTGTSGKLVLGGATVADQTLASLTATGIGGSAVGGNAAVSTLTLNNASATTLGVILGGAGTNENNLSLTKSGAGTLTLSGANTYTGATTVSAGTLKLGAAGALGDGTNNTSGVAVNGSAIFDLGGITANANVPLTLNSNANAFDTGAFLNSGAAATYGGSITLLQQTRFGGGGSMLLSGAITGGGFKIIKDSTGLLELQNSGTVMLGDFQGNRGTLQVNSGTTLNVTAISVGTGSGVGAGLTLNGGSVTSSGAVTFGAGSGSASGTLTLNSGTFTVPALTKGSLTFNVNFNGGTLKANATSATFFSAATNALVKAGGAFIDDGGFAITVGRALDHDTALGATLDGGLTKSGSGTLTLSGINTYTGDTTVKAGTLALDSTGFIATSGKIIVGDAGSSGTVLDLTAKSAFSIGSNQTLKGIGTVNIGAGKTVTINGTHAAGNSVGKQAITGNVDYASSTSIFEWELAANVENGTWDHDNNVGTAEVATRGSAFDAVDISGNLAINSGAIFKVILGTDFDGSNAFWTADRSWDVFSVGGTSSTSFTNFQLFNASAPTTEITSATYSPYGSFSYSFGSGTGTLTWSAVPEPTSALAGLLITAGLLRRKRIQNPCGSSTV